MNKVVLIPDSFKGTMSSIEICAVMEEQIRAYYPRAEVVKIPVADGGEGSVDAFLAAMGGQRVAVEATGPLGEPVPSFYGRMGDTAVIEMAAAAGLPLVGERRDILRATTYGVGELMLHAAQNGAKKLIVGLGGSATNDGGCGAAAACGIRFLDNGGRSFVPSGGSLHRVAGIDPTGLNPALRGVEIIAMCDIDNPLCGPFGASAVFGPQKGASEEDVKTLDDGLAHLAGVVAQQLGREVAALPGAGAAGGMGAGMVAFFGATLRAGIETVLETVGFSGRLQNADLVFTGEGKLDGQSLRGKVVVGVARAAQRAGVPVIAVVGDIGDEIEPVYQLGVSAVFSTNRVAVPFREAKQRARSDLALTMDTIMRCSRLWS